jgi:LuxR family maltose regulon positive regulatory protein
MAGGDAARAAGLVERAAPAMQQARQEATLGRWLDALPEELLPSRPVLTMALIGARMRGGDFAGVPEQLDELEERLAVPDPDRVVVDEEALRLIPAQAAIFRAALALVAGDAPGTLQHAGRALALVEPDDHLPRGSAAALAGLAHWSAGDLGPAHDRYAEAIVHLERAGSVSDALGCSLALSDVEVAQGRLGAAIDTLEGGLARSDRHGGVRGAADMHVALADLLLARGDLDGAARHLAASDALGEHAGLPQHPYRSRVALARLRELQGDPAAALALLEEAERRVFNDFSPPVRPVPAVTARLRLRTGDEAAALRWAAERGLGPGDDLTYLAEYEHATLARILLRRGAVEAGALVDRLLAAAREGGREGSVVELLVLRAVAERNRGDAPAALASLEEALVRAEPEGQVRAFLDEGAPVVELLRTAVRQGRAAGEARRVLAHAADGPAAPAAATGPAGELSDRERDVLRLLRSDLSGPDIARELFVSLNTVRTHTKHIYAKLGVTSRRAAVRRAEELGL